MLASAHSAPPRFGALDAAALQRVVGATTTTMLQDGARSWDGVALAALAERWRGALLAARVGRGDRVLVAMRPGAPFVGALIGALACEATVALAPPDDDADALLETLDARLVLCDANRGGAASLAAATDGAPAHPRVVARAARAAPTPAAALLLRTSGSSGAPRWIALSRRNVGAVLDSHAHALAPARAVVASVLPWHHVFGLVLELLPALARGGRLVRDPAAGRDGESLAGIVLAHAATHLHAVPATIARLDAAADGAAALARLAGGLVGGAPVGAALAERLSHTRLRVGYGQTEASPGIALGEPGEWHARFLGRPVGCEVRIDDDGVLAFRGPNAAIGEWRDGSLVREREGAWRRTGDVVSAADGALRYEGRASSAFKLANGRWVEAHRIERTLRDLAPALDDVVLTTVDGHGLLVVHPEGAAPELGVLRASLGALAALPVATHAVPRDAWPRTPKGETDRRAVQSLAERATQG